MNLQEYCEQFTTHEQLWVGMYVLGWDREGGYIATFAHPSKGMILAYTQDEGRIVKRNIVWSRPGKTNRYAKDIDISEVSG